jgi:ABC-type glucose/galactose transport system permease subunit
MTLMGIQSEWQYVVKGLIIIISVAGGALSHLFSTRKAVRQQKAAL